MFSFKNLSKKIKIAIYVCGGVIVLAALLFSIRLIVKKVNKQDVYYTAFQKTAKMSQQNAELLQKNCLNCKDKF